MTPANRRALVLLLCIAGGCIAALAQRQHLDNASEEKDYREIAAYKLTPSTLAKYEKVCLAAIQLPSPKDEDEKQTESGWVPIDENVRSVEKHPEIVRAITSAGLTPREFLVISYSLMLNSAAMATKQQGSKTALPGTSPANIAFVESHQAEIQQIHKTCQKSAFKDSSSSESGDNDPQ